MLYECLLQLLPVNAACLVFVNLREYALSQSVLALGLLLDEHVQSSLSQLGFSMERFESFEELFLFFIGVLDALIIR